MDSLVRLSDPVNAMVNYLKGHDLIRHTGRCEYVTSPLLTQEDLQLGVHSPPVIAMKSSGLGDGQGHEEQAPYRSMRIDAVAYNETDFEAWKLGLLMHRAFLSALRKRVQYTYDGIEYDTRFITVLQSGGPIPFRDEITFWPSVLYVFNITCTDARDR